MRPRDRLASLFAAIAFSAVLGACAGSETQPTITSTELSQRISSGNAPLILDVRTPEEFAAGHLPGAQNIPHDQLAGRLDELGIERGGEVVVHCHSGRRAGNAEQVLRDAGYTNVRDLEGHWKAWQESGFPTERP